MARYNERNYGRYGRESDYGSDRENFRRNRGSVGRNERTFKNDITDYNYGYEDEGYFGGGSGEGYGRGYLGGSTDYGTGYSGGYSTRRGSGGNYGTEDYGSSYGGGSYGTGYSGSTGSTNYGRSYGRGSDYDRESNIGGRGSDYDRTNYGYNAGRFDRGYEGDRDYNYGNEGYYGGTSAGYGSTYGENYGRDYDRNYGGSNYGQGSERGFQRGSDYDRERDYGRRGRGERGWFEKAADEVASWFGTEEGGRSRESYRGVGTKNYSRSDDRISEDVNDRLSDDYMLDASDIEVSVDNGEVTLSGTVTSKYDKRRAEDITDDVSGVKHVQNNLRVSESSTYEYNTGTTASTSLTGANTGTGSTEMTGTSETTTTKATGKSKSAGGTS